jgi:hypothetical protein
MDFFVNPEDLKGWVKNQKSPQDAAGKILDLVGKDKEQDIMDTCKSIYETEDENAANVLFGVLASHNLTKKTIKVAQNMPQSRQRNGWVRGERNKFNRVVDGFNEGTPWRIDRDKFYNFTHYYTDAISFDEDPTKVYSGEAIWRMYVMDKFTREYQTKEGKWVGGYINDRFYVFPTAGTPDNPDAPRDGGNQMGLAQGERTRKPRPHQYSVERRLEEARGNETYDIETFASKATSMVKIASKVDTSKEADKMYSVFRDVLDMREAGIKYDVILEEVAKHYDVSITGVAQIDKVAQTLKAKHNCIAYEIDGFVKTATAKITPNGSYIVFNPKGVVTVDGKILPKETELVATEKPNQFVVKYHPSMANMEEVVVQANILPTDVIPGGGAQEVGLDENPVQPIQPTQPIEQVAQPMEQKPVQESDQSEFPIEEMEQETIR